MTDGPSTNAMQDRHGAMPVVQLTDVTLRYGRELALDAVTLQLPAGGMSGLIGPDGVGKSSLLSLVAGARRIQEGRVRVLGGDMGDAPFRRAVSPRIAYMPQGLGGNLYAVLSVHENVDFFGRLFGLDEGQRRERIAMLLEGTGLAPFADRAAGKLSGGMKQKLGLCCALIHEPDLLILDEPTTGVDPLARRQFWQLVDVIREQRAGMSVLVATAYMDEARRFDRLVAMDEGRVLTVASPVELLDRTGASSLERAFVSLLPPEKRRGHVEVRTPPYVPKEGTAAIEASGLTKRFGDFTAVDRVSFRIARGEIFGFLGSNGSGKTTTMKMLTGLLPATEGEAWIFGKKVDAHDMATRRRVGYMSQNFSLYTELSVRQNLTLHAQLFEWPPREIPSRVERMAERFGLTQVLEARPNALPLGLRQRLSLAVALIHEPDLLILDEPTSGVDPIARDNFWQLLIDLARQDRVTIFISTHFMNEAERCDRISLMHAGKVLASDTPEALIAARQAQTLEDAFISYLEDADAERDGDSAPNELARTPQTISAQPPPQESPFFSLRRLYSYTLREAMELSRDPIRGILAVVGSVILMFIMGYGISMDVEDLSFAVLDRDNTMISREYVQNIAGSRYFTQHAPILNDQELDERMRSGELTLALEIPTNFGRDVTRGRYVEIGAWIDGSMPQRAETIQGYVSGMHNDWLLRRARQEGVSTQGLQPVTVEVRYRYNPNVESIIAIVPGVIPLLLLLIPAMLTALSIVREKELGSIVNFYVTPVTRLEFLLGKQLPYIALGMLNFLLLAALSIFAFGVPMTGSFLTLTFASLLYVIITTAMGLFFSTFMRSQIAAIFGTAIFTMIPASQYSGLLTPVSALQGMGAVIGVIYPTTHYLTISRGTFSKALRFDDLYASFIPLVIAVPVLIGASALLLRKQET